MREITITVKPSLTDISDPSRLSKVITDIENIIEGNLDLCAEDVAEKILEFARENASQGYRGLPYPGGNARNWAPRDPITDLLYELSPYHTPNLPGLDTGAGRLINSLERHGEDNIFESFGRTVRIGSSFKHAHLLEKGGIRPMEPNIGFTKGGFPNRWLQNAIEAGWISQDEVWRIREQFDKPRFIEPRPFLYPAMWHVRDVELHTAICARTLIKELQTDLELEKIRSIRGEVSIVSR